MGRLVNGWNKPLGPKTPLNLNVSEPETEVTRMCSLAS